MENKKIGANFKMNLTLEETKKYIEEIKKYNNQSVIYFPTSIYANLFIGNNLNVGLQNISTNEAGAFTGEVSALQAASMNIKNTIIGHSERRIIFKETNEEIEKKLVEAQKNNISVVLCIGETLEEKESNQTNKILENQLSVLINIGEKIYETLVIAYEPVWSIGTGKIPTIEEIKENIKTINNMMTKYTDKKIPVWYGGSVNKNNIEELNKVDLIDGFLVGRACTTPTTFIPLIEEIN